MSTTGQFIELCNAHGSQVFIHMDSSVTPCPCLTPEGFRNPIWHLQHPSDPVCDAAGMLPDPSTTLDVMVKGFVHPVQAGAVRRLVTEAIVGMFGEIQADDHVALLPCFAGVQPLDFFVWGQAGEDWLEYNGRRFQVVATNLIPDPSDGNPKHHWELGLRLVNSNAG